MNTHIASLKILYEEIPTIPGDCFIQIRQWETAVSENSELIVEYGQLDESGELITQCQVMPFFMTVRDVLEQFAEISI